VGFVPLLFLALKSGSIHLRALHLKYFHILKLYSHFSDDHNNLSIRISLVSLAKVHHLVTQSGYTTRCNHSSLCVRLSTSCQLAISLSHE
jgi:hypothetical protein